MIAAGASIPESLGYDLEEVLEEERAVQRGDYALVDDFFQALRTRILAGDDPAG